MTDPLSPAERSARMARIGSGLRKNSLERRVHLALCAKRVRHRMYPRVLPSFDVEVPTSRGPLYVAVDGCFWHACPDHYRRPADPRPSWGHDLEAEERARAESRARAPFPWVRVWEHQVRGPEGGLFPFILRAAVRRVEAGLPMAGELAEPGAERPGDLTWGEFWREFGP